MTSGRITKQVLLRAPRARVWRAIGDSVDLADLGTLRRSSLSSEPVDSQNHEASAFRSVRIRRGATFPGIPSGSTARKFSGMVEEAPPWFLTLVPS